MIKDLQAEIWECAEHQGFHLPDYDNDDGSGMTKQEDWDTFHERVNERLMMIVSEASEAMEATRSGDYKQFGEELADIMIRTMECAEHYGIDLEKEVIKKMRKNWEREPRHGKRF